MDYHRAAEREGKFFPKEKTCLNGMYRPPAKWLCRQLKDEEKKTCIHTETHVFAVTSMVFSMKYSTEPY